MSALRMAEHLEDKGISAPTLDGGGKKKVIKKPDSYPRAKFFEILVTYIMGRPVV